MRNSDYFVIGGGSGGLASAVSATIRRRWGMADEK
jgi:pyruvate/2-oxoglutarate dehydrogenase complex dihydrolipoamide dehydrogenase (E3) component